LAGRPKSYGKKPADDAWRIPPTQIPLFYALTLDPSITDDVVERLKGVMRGLDAKGFTVRICAKNQQLLDITRGLGVKCEVILPFPDFNKGDGDYSPGFHTASMTALINPYFDNIPKGVRPFVLTDTTLLMGKNLKEHSKFLITYTPDGITHTKDKTKETGYEANVIMIANRILLDVFNMFRSNTPDLINQKISTM